MCFMAVVIKLTVCQNEIDGGIVVCSDHNVDAAMSLALLGLGLLLFLSDFAKDTM